MKVFIHHNFGQGAELPAYGNEKCSCVICFSKDVTEGPEAITASSQACDTMGKATGGSRDGGWLYRQGGGRWSGPSQYPVPCFT